MFFPKMSRSAIDSSVIFRFQVAPQGDPRRVGGKVSATALALRTTLLRFFFCNCYGGASFRGRENGTKLSNETQSLSTHAFRLLDLKNMRKYESHKNVAVKNNVTATHA